MKVLAPKPEIHPWSSPDIEHKCAACANDARFICSKCEVIYYYPWDCHNTDKLTHKTIRDSYKNLGSRPGPPEYNHFRCIIFPENAEHAEFQWIQKVHGSWTYGQDRNSGDYLHDIMVCSRSEEKWKESNANGVIRQRAGYHYAEKLLGSYVFCGIGDLEGGDEDD
ncbi:hypothetical protein BDV96DRAFT_654092 [Lophiotrema nucula]|uniref:MYND-type zinc finger protein samB n=1 Tax=Lophiotrema nucula TaxID=690887 RepID=A0A6A5YJ40_9PLEO|nr:hypothetical protein BDV96DRAFT_654092 [Lophiotrema nucula]